MKISIVTVTYNSAATLEETFLSVFSQTYPDIEYIVVDGGSKDGTLPLIEKYKSKISKSVSEKDKGLYDALNKGIAMATGEVIALLHSDDFYLDQHVIQKYADKFANKACDAVYSDLYYVDQDNTNKIVRKWKSGEYNKNAFLYGWMPPHPTFFVRKKIYDQYGSFNIKFKSAADYELMLRFIHKHQINSSYLSEYTVKMRIGGKSNVTVQNRLKANLEDREAWVVNGLRPKWFTLYLKPIRKILQFFLFIP